MIIGCQIRAARALINISQDELAEAAGLTPQAIRKIEAGSVTPREGTISDITKVFYEQGIEFIAERGVAKRDEAYRLFEGSDSYLRLLNEIYFSLRNEQGAEVLSICTDDDISPPEVVRAIQQWHDNGIKCRFLTHDKARRFDFPLSEYRVIPEKFFTNSVMIVYGNHVATLRGTNDAVIIVRDKDQANMLRGLFDMIWLQSNEPKVETL